MQHKHTKRSGVVGRIVAVLAVFVLAIALMPGVSLAANEAKLTVNKLSNGTVTATIETTKDDKTETTEVAKSSSEKDVDGKVASKTKVTLTVAPDEGYQLKSIKVTTKDTSKKDAKDEEIKLTQDEKDKTKYTFEMSATDAVVAAEFEAETNATTEGTAEGAEVTPQVDTNITVTFDANNGSGSTATQTLTSGVATALTANSFTYTGYTFSGWNTSADGTGTSYEDKESVTFTTNTTLYAQWTINTYTVTFNYNGHGGTSTTTTVEHGKTVAEPTAPTATGYVFGGWYTEAACTNAYDFSKAVTADLTLYAKWDPCYTVVFDANGGSGTMSDQVILRDVATALTANAYTLTADSKTYTFVQWNTVAVDADNSGTIYADQAEVTNLAETGKTATLYAQWGHVVKFNANGGSGTMADQPMVVCVTATDTVAKNTVLYNGTLTKNTFTKDGSVFAGWNTAADGTGTTIKDGATISKLPKDYTLYAQWGHTVSYDANGGSGTMTSQTIVESTGGTVKTNKFTRSGYTFSGWNTAADGSGTSYKAGYTFAANELTSDITLYAQWTKKSTSSSASTKSSTLASTADPTLLATPAVMAAAGGALVVGGKRKRK